MAESRSYTETAIVSSLQLNIIMAMYTYNVTAHRGITVLSEIPGMLGD